MERSRLGTFWGTALLTAVFSFLGAGCGTETPEPAKGVKILSFQASPPRLESAGTTTLSWKTENATTIRLSHGDLAVVLDDAPVAEGSIEVSVAETTVFELVAADRRGRTASRTITVEVENRIDLPVIGSFSGPDAVAADGLGVGRALLEWTGVVGADTLVLEADNADPLPLHLAQTPDGEIEVKIDATTVFTLVATNAGGETTAEVEVKLALPPAIDTLTASRLWVGSGESVEVSWTTRNASAVELRVNQEKVPSVDPTLVDGSAEVALNFDSTIELRAYNEVGEVNSETIDVKVALPLLELFEGSSTSLWLGESVDFEWESQGGARVTITLDGADETICASDDPAVVDGSTCRWSPPVGDHLVWISVENGSGVASGSWSVQVASGPAILDFWASPTEVNLGDEITVNWKAGPDPAGQDPVLTVRDGRGGTFAIDEQEGSMKVRMDQGVGAFVLTLEATTDHPLSIPAEAAAEVFVHGPPAANLTATPAHFDHQVEDVVLSWTTEFAGEVVLYAVDGEDLVEVLVVPTADHASGSHHVAPLEDTLYRLVVTGPLGPVAADEVVVTVAPPEVLSLTADQTEVGIGSAVLLTWQTRMADEIALDIFGPTYVVGESTEPYIDAAALGGTHLPLTDECNGPPLIFGCVRLTFPDGFTFPFDGLPRHELRLYHNGYVSFDANHLGLLGFQNTLMPVAPTSLDTHIHLAVLWDWLGWDAAKYPEGNIYYLLRDDPVKGRSLVLQWKDANLYNKPPPQVSLNFEIVLWEQGGFEYRYGPMDPGNNPTESRIADAQGHAATIGYQDGSLVGHTIRFDQTVEIFGSLVDRTFTYTPTPTIEKSGSYLWYPLASAETVTATLEARRASSTASRTVEVKLLETPEVFIRERPAGSVLAGETFRLGWSAGNATSIEVEDGSGTVRCTAMDELAVEQGYCSLQESSEGVYTYSVRAVAPNGSVREKQVEVAVYRPFEIVSFQANRTILEPGQSVVLNWVTSGGQELSLKANGVELLAPGTAGGTGSFIQPNVTAATAYVLRLTNSIGMFVEERIDLWDATLDVNVSATVVRPGTPITVNVGAAGVGSAPPPAILGTLPMKEVPGSPYVDISAAGMASEIGPGEAVMFPSGFEFPFFSERYTGVRVSENGYLSFRLEGGEIAENQLLPHETDVHLAPFWDSLERGAGSSTWVMQPDADSFVIQWKDFNQKVGSKVIPNTLNFQVVLSRDGSFEYRYGWMIPPFPPFEDDACLPSTCMNEASGSSATIGYQAPGSFTGYTHHFGGSGQSASNVPFPDGLSGKTFRYEPLSGSGTLEWDVARSQTLMYCLSMPWGQGCKSVEIVADAGVDSFTVDQRSVRFGESTDLRWTTHGGIHLRVLDESGSLIFETTSLAEVDSGGVSIAPTASQTYTLELVTNLARLAETVAVEVERMVMNVTAPGTSHPGAPVAIQWDLSISDPSLNPVVLTPMEEKSGLPFSARDISADPDAIEIWGPGTTAGISEHQFTDGFTFDFLGTTMTSARISVEGYISFDSTATSSTGVNQFIPNNSTSYRRVHLAPFWDDLSTLTKGRVLAKQWDADTYVIQWSSMSLNLGSTGSTNEYFLNFLVVLHRNGDFEYRYGLMLPPPVPTTSSTACYPSSCENEANGAAATIGYQEPSGQAGHLLHLGGLTPNPGNSPMPGGLSDRSWKFTKTTARSGSVEVRPWEATYYDICALEPTTGELFCPGGSLKIDASWGIAAFDAMPWAPARDEAFTLTWDVVGLDELRLYRNDVLLFRQVGAEISNPGSLQQTATEKATYVLEGLSLGRVVQVERVVEPRGFDLNVTVPTGPFLPGSAVQIGWTLTAREPGFASVNAPMVEIGAGPGAPGAFVDLSSVSGANLRPLSEIVDNDRLEVELPFAFPYFGGSYDRFLAYVDGYISFDVASVTGIGANTDLPNRGASQSRVHLAPFWDDLTVRGPEEIWTHAPNPTTFIIQWRHFSRTAGSDADNRYDLNWQVVFFADGSFEYRYGRMAAPPQPFAFLNCYPNSCALEAQGSSATVGYQKVDASFGHTLHYGGEGVSGVVPFPGGLGNRTFRYQPQASGTIDVLVDRTKEVEICGALGSFQACELVTLHTIAAPGDLMITELMLDPAGGPNQRWFELRNLTKEAVDLRDFEVRSLRGSYRVDRSVVVPSLGFAVFAASTVPGRTPDAVFGSSLNLDPVVDKLEIYAGGTRIAGVEWAFDWDVPPGKTLFLDSGAQLRGRISSSFPDWCEGSQLGSPGAGELGCVGDYYAVDPNGSGVLIDLSTIGIHIGAFQAANKVAGLRAPDFKWVFFDQKVTNVFAGGNGWLSFAEGSPTGGANRNSATLPRSPTVTPPSPLLAAFWDQLVCTPKVHDCSFRYYYGDIGGEKVFVAEWRDFRRTTAVGGITFQAQLYPNGDVKVVFGDAWSADHPDSVNAGYYRGSTGWIGFENVGRVDYVTGLLYEEVDLADRVFHFVRR